MTPTDLIEMLKDDDVREMLRDVIVDLVRTDSELRASVVQVLHEDVSFYLDCSSWRDYYSEGYSLSLSIDGKEVSSTSFSVDASR